MARYQCPSCGASYNGKRCRQCNYEHFAEEIAHGGHVHTGEPLVIDAPVRRPIKRKDPFACEEKTRKRHPMAGFLALMVLIGALMPVLQNWGLELEAQEAASAVAVPEPTPWMPENVQLLWEEESIRIYADWNPEADTLAIYTENNYSHPVWLYSAEVTVNGFLMEGCGVSCDAYSKSTMRSAFCFDDTALHNAGIQDIHSVSFCLAVFDQENTPLFSTDTITLTDGSGEMGASAIFGGTELLVRENMEIRYLTYTPNAIYPEEVSQGELLFYMKNDTDRTLQIYAQEASVAGAAVELFLYQELPPYTQAIASMYLSQLEEMGIDRLEEMAPMILRLGIQDPEDPAFLIMTEPVVLPLE